MPAKVVSPEEFKKVSVKPGTKENFLVRIGQMSTSTDIHIPVVVVQGRKDGPKTFVTAGQHAEETGSIDAAKRFGGQLTPDEVSGTVVVCPLQNPGAWAFRTRLYPLDAPTVSDIGSLKKGEANGILTDRAFYALTECISDGANFGLDIHATHLDSMNYPRTMTMITGDEPEAVHKKRVELSRKVGYEVIHLWNVGKGRGGLTSVLSNRGAPCIAIEAGEGWRALEPFPSILIRGIKNFCKAVGNLKGEPEMPDLQVEVTKRFEITCNYGGFSNLFVKCGDYVKKGQVVGQVRNMFDEVLEELTSPANGIIIRCSLLPTVATGARLCNVSETDIGDKWTNRKLPTLEKQITFSGYSRAK